MDLEKWILSATPWGVFEKLVPSNLPNHPKWIWKAGWQFCWFTLPCHFCSHSFECFWCMMYVRLTFTYLVYLFYTTWCVDFLSRIVQDPKELRQTSFCQVQMVHRHPTPDGEEDVGWEQTREREDWGPLTTEAISQQRDWISRKNPRKRKLLPYLCFVQSNVLPYTGWHRRSAKSSTSPWESSRRGAKYTVIFALQKV